MLTAFCLLGHKTNKTHRLPSKNSPFSSAQEENLTVTQLQALVLLIFLRICTESGGSSDRVGELGQIPPCFCHYPGPANSPQLSRRRSLRFYCFTQKYKVNEVDFLNRGSSFITEYRKLYERSFSIFPRLANSYSQSRCERES